AAGGRAGLAARVPGHGLPFAARAVTNRTPTDSPERQTSGRMAPGQPHFEPGFQRRQGLGDHNPQTNPKSAWRRCNIPPDREQCWCFCFSLARFQRARTSKIHNVNLSLNMTLEGRRGACLYRRMSTILIEVRRAKPSDAAAI